MKVGNKFGEILTRIRDNEYRRRAALKMASKRTLPNAAAARSEEGATAPSLCSTYLPSIDL